MLSWLWLSAALAGPQAYGTCTRAIGAIGDNAPLELLAVGPGTQVVTTDGKTRLSGLWRLGCDAGTRLDPEASLAAPGMLPAGTVVTAISAEAAACFDASCALPPNLCLDTAEGGVRVVHCVSRTPAGESSWTAPPVRDSTAVVLGGRVLKVRDPSGGAIAPPPTTPPAATVVPPKPTTATPAKAAAPAATSKPPAARLPANRKLPPDPPQPCRTTPSVAAASKVQVEAGNERALAGDLDGAFARYQAALALDACDAFAWVAIGDSLLEQGSDYDAAHAFRNAVALVPDHYHAWTQLGRAEEDLGHQSAANEAYRKALKVKPGHPPAEQGAARTGSR